MSSSTTRLLNQPTAKRSQRKTKTNMLDRQAELLKVKDGVWSSVKIILQPKPHAVHFDWSKSSLRPYNKYRKLLGERKFARDVPTNPSKVFFLVLSPGIRNCIYGQLLHFPYLELAGKSARKKNGYAWNYHMRFYKYEVKPALKLLRTCKQINREGSSIFYGENEFRFSATYGSYILLSFCRTIGKANTARLTTITMHAPFGGCNESKDTGPQVSGNALSNFRWLSRNIMGLHEEGYAAGKFNIPRTLSNTSISAGLQTLRLVVPDTMRFVPFDKDLRNIGCEFELYDHLSQLKMQQLKVELVFLDSLDDPPFLDWEETKGDADLIAYCRSKAWEVRCMAYDDRGRYDVSEQLLAGEGEEAVEEIVDEMM